MQEQSTNVNRVLDFIIEWGPVKKSHLKRQFSDMNESSLNSKIFWNFVDALVKENIIYSKKFTHTTIYYSLDTPNIKSKLHDFGLYYQNKKFSIFPHLREDFFQDLVSKHEIILEYKDIFDDLLMELSHYYFKSSFNGRIITDLFLVFGKLLIKKKLYFLLRNQADIELLRRWLTLYEIFHQETLETFRGKRPKPYQYYIKMLINDPEFSNKEDINKILETPDPYLRFQFLLYYFNIEKEIANFIKNSIKICNLLGYSIRGKGIRGIMAALYYLYSINSPMVLSQKSVSTKFNTSEVTLRARLEEIKKYIVKQSDSNKEEDSIIIYLGEKETIRKIPIYRASEKLMDRIDISTNFGKSIVKDFSIYIDELVQEYKAEFVIREIINSDFILAITARIEEIKPHHKEIPYDLLNQDVNLKILRQKAQKQEDIFNRIREIGKDIEYDKLTPLLELFKIILFLRDFNLGESLKIFKNKWKVNENYIRWVAEIVFHDNKDYFRRRFYHTHFFHDDIISYAQAALKGELKKSSFSSLVNSQLQTLIEVFRLEKGIKVEKSVFHLAGVSREFVSWIVNLSEERFNSILSHYTNPKSKAEFFPMCSKINRNSEILKYIVYSLTHSEKSSKEISKIAGKCERFIERYRKLINKEYINLSEFVTASRFFTLKRPAYILAYVVIKYDAKKLPVLPLEIAKFFNISHKQVLGYIKELEEDMEYIERPKKGSPRPITPTSEGIEVYYKTISVYFPKKTLELIKKHSILE